MPELSGTTTGVRNTALRSGDRRVKGPSIPSTNHRANATRISFDPAPFPQVMHPADSREPSKRSAAMVLRRCHILLHLLQAPRQ
jgi:hypothetical protein